MMKTIKKESKNFMEAEKIPEDEFPSNNTLKRNFK
jgi:hypothetical protein